MSISGNEKRNTVSAENQLKNSESVKIVEKPDSVLRVLFVGNSITRHAPSPNIGWKGDWGMAATSSEKDYVHLTVAGIEKMVGQIDYGIAQVSKWERNYAHGIDILNKYHIEAKKFNADIVIINLGENIDSEQCKKINFRPYLEELIKFFGANAEVIVVGVFWRNDFKDNVFKRICKERNFTFCAISDLEQNECNLALKQFSHSGVAIHPGDCGMQAISKRLLDSIRRLKIIKSIQNDCI